MANGRVLKIVQCANCGKDVEVRHKKRLYAKHICCSTKCMYEFKKKNNPNYIPCVICGQLFYRKPSHRAKTGDCCSMECAAKHRSNTFCGENNANYGKRGKENPNWKSDEKINTYGYRLIRCVEHPFANSDGFVFEHRLIAEQYLLTDDNSIIINGIRYLNPEFHVHHIDKNPLNNDPKNLQIVTKQEHAQMHGKEKQNKVMLICEYCHKEYEVIKSREKTSKFCSQGCRTRFREEHKTGQDITCPVCHTTFYTTDTNRTCCSVKCSGIYNNRGTTIVPCSNCSKNFKIRNSRLSRSSRVFCSRACYSEFKQKQSTSN